MTEAKTRLPVLIAPAAALVAGGAAALLVTLPSPRSSQSSATVNGRILEWWAQLESGHIDRTQLSGEYSTRLADDAVLEMSRYLKDHNYGVQPSRAEVSKERHTRDQTLYVMKLDFPRGDAASLMVGIDNYEQITGVSSQYGW
jgi:hypothetical protein